MSLQTLSRRIVNKYLHCRYDIQNLEIPLVLKKELHDMYIFDNLHDKVASTSIIASREIYNSLSTCFDNESPVLNAEQYIYLMWHPREIPNFAYEFNVVKHYKYCLNKNSRYKYCEACWEQLDDKQNYKYCTKRTYHRADELLYDVIWEDVHWCDLCTTNPLFNIREGHIDMYKPWNDWIEWTLLFPE